MVYGSWLMVDGLWLMVYGLWFMVNGLWFMGYGLWVMGYGLRLSTTHPFSMLEHPDLASTLAPPLSLSTAQPGGAPEGYGRRIEGLVLFRWSGVYDDPSWFQGLGYGVYGRISISK